MPGLTLALGLSTVGLIPFAWALDPSTAITQYHQDVWSEGTGLPQGSVQAITQTRDGYLWVGTRDGLARFDGVKFTVFQAENNPGLESNDIRALCEDRSGQLWVGTFNGGVSRYRDGRFTCYKRQDGLPNNGVLDIFEDRQGNLWMGTWNGLARYRDGKFTAYTTADGLAGATAYSICEDGHGRIWIGTSGGLNWLESDRIHHCPSAEGWVNLTVRKVYVDRAGVLWAGSHGGGLARLEDGKFTRYRTHDGLADDRVSDIYQDSGGNLWIATWNGLSRFTGGRMASYSKQDGLPHNLVGALYEDPEKSLWIGTHGGGLARLRDGKLRVYTTREGLVNNFAKCVFAARDGTLWIGTEGGGLSRYRDGRFTNYSIEDGLPSNFILTIGEDAAGKLWIGTAYPSALCSLEADGRINSYTGSQGYPIQYRTRSVFGDRDGNLWIGGSGGGLCRYRDGKFSCYSLSDGLPSDLIRVIAQDREGNLWVGANDGLCRYHDGQFTVFTTRDGLAHNAVYSVYEDGEGTLWFGTQRGLTRYAGGKFRAYTTKDGLFQNIIYQILEDDQQTLWMSGNRGIFSLAKQAVADFDRGRIPALPCVGYGLADGMKSTQCEGGTQSAGCRSPDGRLWFPTVNGVAVIDPKAIKRNLRPPPVLIEQVFADNRLLDSREPIQLPPHARELRFDYTALSFVAPEKVRFRYQLEGLDDKWVEAQTRRVAVYNQLPPGNYRFRVQACNNDGVWNEAGAALAFSRAPHFYQTGAFFGFFAAALAAGAWGFHRHRMKRAQDKFMLVLTERSRIARELHDTLAQGFAGIGFQLEAVAAKLTEAPAHAQQHLNLALQMVRHSLGEARRSVMNLRSLAADNGDLARALADTARQIMADKPVEVHSTTSGPVRSLPANMEDNLLRIGQEAITNSLKHARAGRIRIGVNYQPRSVVLRIHDDGQGFDPRCLPVADGAHFGLLGMRERAKQIGAQLTVSSQPGQGTEVLVEAPFG
jgi:ligand-binding sensor domain-containing protein/signal transduction histidine kinase